MAWKTLPFAAPSAGVCLRPVSGQEELAVGGSGFTDAIRLLDGLLEGSPGVAFGPGQAVELTIPDRDRLLALVYMQTYGSRIAGTINCIHCRKLFDVHFELNDLLAALTPPREQEVPDGLPTRLSDGSYRMSDGTRFRLPTGRDEAAVQGLPAGLAEQALLRRCLADFGEAEPAPETAQAVQEAMETVAPLLDLEIGAYCPECGGSQDVRFDIQHYLLGALLKERPQLIYELHRLASAYGWSLREILGLDRLQRRMLVEMIENELSPTREIAE